MVPIDQNCIVLLFLTQNHVSVILRGGGGGVGEQNHSLSFMCREVALSTSSFIQFQNLAVCEVTSHLLGLLVLEARS